MWGQRVAIDYDAVIDYLLSQCDRDDPNTTLSFEQARKLLEEQADAMLDLDPDATEDVALTEILLEHYWTGGTIDRIVVTGVPGVVMFRNGQMYKLPLVLIELKYRT